MKRHLYGVALWVAISMAVPASAEEDKVKAYQPPEYKVTVPEALKLTPQEALFKKRLSEVQQNAPVVLDEAVALALEAHENLIEAQAAVDQALAQVVQSRSAALPQIGINVTHTKPLYFNTALPAGLVNASGADAGALAFFLAPPEGPTERLQISQLLYDFNRTRSAVQAAEAQTKAAQHGLEVTRRQLIFEVTNAYLELLRTQALAKVQLLTAENQALHVTEARKLHETGLGLPIDVVRAQTAYANAVQQFAETRNQALAARVTLATLMGIDPRTPFQVEDPGSPFELTRSLDSLVGQALEQRPDLAQSKALVEAGEFALENARAGNRPRLSTSLTFTANQVLPQPASENLSLMLNLEIPIFDGGLTRAQTEQAEAVLRGNEAKLSRQQRQVVSEVTQAFVQSHTARQKLRNVEVEVSGAEESVRVASGRYRLGLGRFIEVLDAERALATARTSEVNAVTQLSQAHARLKLAVGDSAISKSLPEPAPEEPNSEPPGVESADPR